MQDYQVMPELTPDEYEALKADIAINGVLVPVEVDEFGNILDGYNRVKICDELGIEYDTIVRPGLDEETKYEIAYTLNLSRRHLSPEQKLTIARRMKLEHPEWSINKIAKMVGMDYTQVSVQLMDLRKLDTVEGEDGKYRPASAEIAELQRDNIIEKLVEHPEKSDRQIARETGASPTTVGTQRKKILSVFNPSARDREALKDPDIVTRLAENEGMNVAGAIREQRRDQLVERLDSVEAREAKAIEGVYDVIVVDPPWPMARIETDRFPHAVKMDYPVMSLDEIKNIKIPAADDCHVFLWTTQKYLRTAFDVLEAWDVRHVWTFVWVKNDGMKPFQLPKSSVEFILYGHIGNPKFVNEDKFWSHIQAPITHHSEKPEAFYEMIRHVTAGRRLDMFNRRSIDGFETWGKEAD